MEEITIEWRGPFSYPEVIDKEGKDPNERQYAIAWEPLKLPPQTKYVGSAFDLKRKEKARKSCKQILVV
ncbi:unnamed protein product [marine sediment metagenome]|uniref:Uncharacterized protein n=1 Tax=marine sediment metagenome TaxID=412755 RepID=X1VME0_9ZZZZ